MPRHVPCRFFQQGTCKKGDDCDFRHPGHRRPGQSDLRNRIQGRQVTVGPQPTHQGAAARKDNSSHSRWQKGVRSHLIEVGGIATVDRVSQAVPLPPHMKKQGNYSHWLREMGLEIVGGGVDMQVRLQQGRGRKRAAPDEEPHRPAQRRRDEPPTLSAMYATDDASSDEVPSHGEVTLEEVMAQVAAVMYSWGHLM